MRDQFSDSEVFRRSIGNLAGTSSKITNIFSVENVTRDTFEDISKEKLSERINSNELKAFVLRGV